VSVQEPSEPFPRSADVADPGVQIVFTVSGDFVDPACRSRSFHVPRGVYQAVLLELTERAIEESRVHSSGVIIAVEFFQELVPVGGLFAE